MCLLFDIIMRMFCFLFEIMRDIWAMCSNALCGLTLLYGQTTMETERKTVINPFYRCKDVP